MLDEVQPSRAAFPGIVQYPGQRDPRVAARLANMRKYSPSSIRCNVRRSMNKSTSSPSIVTRWPSHGWVVGLGRMTAVRSRMGP